MSLSFWLQFSALVLILGACSLRPHSLKKLTRQGIDPHESNVSVTLDENTGRKAEVIYLGCGGIGVIKDQQLILVDPFFSYQPAMRVGKSVLFGENGKKKLRTDRKMLAMGLASLKDDSTDLIPQAIINAHSHYDHLMDIPAVVQSFESSPLVLLSQTARNICHNVLDSGKMIVLEKHMTTSDKIASPIELKQTDGNRILIYPILSKHNPHYRNLKFFSGEQTRPVHELKDPLQKTRANLWLEGNTFSFLIDYTDGAGTITFRIFIQSSSCNAPSGFPPAELLSRHKVDLAFIGVASYEYSADYPCELLQHVAPRQIVWVHWEDFFRRYNKDPKTLRGTDLPAFFDLPCVAPYKNSGKLLWPRVKLSLVY